MIKFRILIFILIIGITSCSNEDKKNANHGAIAKAYHEYLYLNAIDNLSKNANKADSINAVSDQVNKWLVSRIINKESKTQLPATIKEEIDKKVIDYQNELYAFAYEREITKQKMDTFIADSVIVNFYDKYVSNYLLEEPYLRFIYVKCDKKEYVKEVETWLKDSIDLHNLEDFCSEELQACHLYPESWVSIKQFLSKLNGIDIDMKKVKSGNAYFKIKNNNVHYLLRILEYKEKNEPAPLSFVKNDIQTILLNKKKVDFFNSLKQDLLKKELDKGTVKIFEQN